MDYCLSAGSKEKSIHEIINYYAEKNIDKSLPDISLSQYFLECYSEMQKQLFRQKTLHLYKTIDLPLCRILHNMEAYGIKIDITCLQKLSTAEVAIRVVLKAVGQISESDVLLAAASDAILIGFNVRPSSQANKLAENEGVQIKQYSIIYNAIEEIKNAMEGMLEPKVEEKEVATVEIREVYKFDKATVAGSYVTEGKIKRDHKIKVFRDGILVYPRQEGGYAELGSLKRYKDDAKEVSAGMECGLTVKNYDNIKVGDVIEAFEENEVKRTL